MFDYLNPFRHSQKRCLPGIKQKRCLHIYTLGIVVTHVIVNFINMQVLRIYNTRYEKIQLKRIIKETLSIINIVEYFHRGYLMLIAALCKLYIIDLPTYLRPTVA